MKTIDIRRASNKSRIYFMWLWLKIGERLMDPDSIDQEACSSNIDHALKLKNSVGIRFVEMGEGQRIEDSQRILRRMWAWTKELGG